MEYITKEGEEAIRQFKYKGGDLSISYKYVWSPLAEFILQFIPATWAPNTITVVGLLFHVVGTLILASFTPFGSPAPRWALFLYGLTVFIYQTLDNVDGKQARKLHNSTPLGMIMDHGCDALGLLFLSIGVARVICLNDFQLFIWVFSIGVTFSFYISAWCQYYSDGLMILGKVNAVDDGIPVVWMLAIFSSIFGQEIWMQPVIIFGTTLLVNQLIAYGIIAAGFIQIYSIVAQAGHHFTKNVGGAILDLLHLAWLLVAIFFITKSEDLCDRYFPGIVVGLGFTMSRTVSYTLLCSVANMKFQQFQPSVLIYCIVYPVYLTFGTDFVNPGVVVYGIALLTVVEYCVFVVSSSRHIARVLNIRIFHVFAPKQVKHN